MEEFQKFCTYTYIAGQKKGQVCGRFRRKGYGYCYLHQNQFNKLKNKRTVSEPPIEKKDIVDREKITRDYSKKQAPHQLKIEKSPPKGKSKKDHSSSSSSHQSSSSECSEESLLSTEGSVSSSGSYTEESTESSSSD